MRLGNLHAVATYDPNTLYEGTSSEIELKTEELGSLLLPADDEVRLYLFCTDE